MKNTKIILGTIALFIALTSATCGKKNCFDAALYEAHKNDFCTEEWLGVVGCDGKTYSNECHANRLGIRLK